MNLTREERKLVDNLTMKHTSVVTDMAEAYEVNKDRFHRDVFHTINDEFPELDLPSINMSKEDIGEFMVKVSNGRKETTE